MTQSVVTRSTAGGALVDSHQSVLSCTCRPQFATTRRGLLCRTCVGRSRLGLPLLTYSRRKCCLPTVPIGLNIHSSVRHYASMLRIITHNISLLKTAAGILRHRHILIDANCLSAGSMKSFDASHTKPTKT
jgi:hypothetical protein